MGSPPPFLVIAHYASVVKDTHTHALSHTFKDLNTDDFGAFFIFSLQINSPSPEQQINLKETGKAQQQSETFREFVVIRPLR